MATKTSVIEGADLVGQIIEYDGQIKQKVIQIYDHIKKFIKSKEFIGTDVEDEIKTEFGDIVDNIEKQKEKVMVDECPIVIAGETSAGKSSFINLLLGKDILPSQLLSCTTTICRLRNSDTVGIAVTDEDDKKINIDVNYVDDKDFRLQLKKYVSRTSDQENYKYVDISLPLPLLKSNTLIIDTPGIGTSPELNNRLLDFLPNAMAFIYIINSSNAGGLQGDRASEKCASISKELYTYLNKKETTDRMFKFSVHEYPTGRYQWFIKEKAKDLILGRINAETREWCRMNMVENINVELKAILQESFSKVHSEMEEGRKELSEFEISLDKRYSFDKSTRDRNFLDDFEDTVLSWPILPIAFPLSFVITAVLTPLLIPLVIKDIIDKLDRHGYNENKQEQMQKWCLEFLKEYNQQSIQKLIEETYLDDFITRVKHLTDYVIPKRIEADEKYIHHIIEDLRNSSLISRQYRPLENRCMFILGMIMLLDMDLEFSGFKHSDEYIETHNTADTEIGRGAFSDVYSTEILIANKYKKAAVKTLRQPLEGNEESYIQLAEVHNLR
ncbi:Hypothetical predicted protein [Mytilus galloprovincialis]|uniref:Dynamin N-terminal domain-containing protein n=1 Tax=Mytilus galloprovincialis TaxID=29158 RepID=A0A8B6GWY2_MYTGA|nr:Hypothetical predicted protein [Mytilus galloprovincialis]